MRIRLLALLCLAALNGLACGSSNEPLGSPETERLASTSDALLGATVTCGFPEVGIVTNGSMKCTAELVAPDMILSAAHCFNYETDEDGSTLYIFKINAYGSTCGAPEQIFQVKRIHSFVASHTVNYDTGFKDDVAIAQLTRAVPSQVASPMNFHAGSIPALGTTATALGHGARDSTNCANSASDLKKGEAAIPIDSLVSGNVRDSLAPFNGAVCGGDSGGPVFTGPDRNIFWVNAAGNGEASWYGEVWRLTTQLDGVMESWSCPAGVWWDGSAVTQDERYPYAHVCGADRQNYECDPTLRNWRALGGQCGDTSCQCAGGTALGGIAIDPNRTTCGSTACGMDQLVYECAAGDWQAIPGSHCGEAYDPGAGTWTSTGSMAQSRRGHTATLLNNGKVLVAGGQGGASGAFLASAELYDPATGSWSSTGSFSQARHTHTATLLTNGKVLIAGGYATTTGRLATAQVYDPATGTWSATGSFALPRYLHTATRLTDGRVLMVGGYGTSGALTSAQIYNPATGTWAATGSLATGRYYHTATLLPDGKVLVVGGGNGTSTSITTSEVYNPATGTWTATATPPRFLHTETVLPGGKVLVTGGSDSGTIFTTAQLRDPATGTWSATGSLTQARYTHSATLLPSGLVLIAGGRSASVVLSSAELYNPVTGTSTATGSLAQIRRGHTATLLPNGKVLLVGGESQDNGYLASAELY